MKNTILKYGLMAFLAVFYTLPALAQGDPGTGGIGDEDPDPGAPIDSWMLILVFAAITVGAYFIWKQKRKAIA